MAIEGSTAEIMPIPVITVNIPTIMSLLDVLVFILIVIATNTDKP
jgi:hypothetical protein